MTTKHRILEAASDLLGRSAEADISTRAVCDAAGITAPALYHHFGDKDGLLSAVVDFGWEQFLTSKRALAATLHDHIADDLRAGWDNHLEFARENANFYALMWSPGVAPMCAAMREAHTMLRETLERGAARGQLSVSPETATRMVMAAVSGAALSRISQPELFGDDAFAVHLREALIAAITLPDTTTAASKRGAAADSSSLTLPTLAAAAATLNVKLATESTQLAPAEQALMRQWLSAIADGPTATPSSADNSG